MSATVTNHDIRNLGTYRHGELVIKQRKVLIEKHHHGKGRRQVEQLLAQLDSFLRASHLDETLDFVLEDFKFLSKSPLLLERCVPSRRFGPFPSLLH